jgi:hypothetical protein
MEEFERLDKLHGNTSIFIVMKSVSDGSNILPFLYGREGL